MSCAVGSKAWAMTTWAVTKCSGYHPAIRMHIIQATFGVFHHFELARELERRGHLERVFSTFPWRRLQREGVPRDKVEAFPWVHTGQMLLEQRNLLPTSLREIVSYRNATTFDAWLTRRMPPCDAFVALSGAGLKSARKVKERGGKYVCDRGSTHRIFQRELLREEYLRWNLPAPPSEAREEEREAQIYAEADAITVPSTAAKRSFVEYGFAPERIHVIPYGVRLERFHPDGEPPAEADAAFEVLFVGAVSVRKGVPYLLEAFAKLKHARKRLRVVGHVAPGMTALLARFPQENVEFLGARPQHELVGLMSQSHVMVLPSIEEGLALVQGQALACGCPVIATTATGAEDLFTDGVEGYVVPIRSPEALRERMQRFADDLGLRERMSEAALQRVHILGGWTQYGDRWEALLRDLTGNS